MYDTFSKKLVFSDISSFNICFGLISCYMNMFFLFESGDLKISEKYVCKLTIKDVFGSSFKTG